MQRSSYLNPYTARPTSKAGVFVKLPCVLVLMLLATAGLAHAQVALTFPTNGATSTRVLQDFHWETLDGVDAYDFQLELLNPNTGSFELFYELENIAEQGELTNFGNFTHCRFDPAVFLDRRAVIALPNGGVIERAPAMFPGHTYRWSVRAHGATNPWSSRELTVAHDPHAQAGLNSHLTMPSEWFQELSLAPPTDEQLVNDLSCDLKKLNPPYLFEGMLMAWGRDAFRSESDKFREVEKLVEEGLGADKPAIISQSIFQPFRVREVDGAAQQPVLGEDYFTMFNFDTASGNPDADYFDPTTFQMTEGPFSRHDVRVRPLYLFHTMHPDAPAGSGGELSFNVLAEDWDQLRVVFTDWLEQPNPTTRAAVLDSQAAFRAKADGMSFVPNAAVGNAFGAYVRDAVTRFGNSVRYWHLANEPNGYWPVSPSLLARQLVFFAEQARLADPNAKVITPSLFIHGPSCSGENWPEGNVDLFWLRELVRELRTMNLDQLPFDAVGLNMYLSKGANPQFGGQPGQTGGASGCTLPCADGEERDCLLDHYKNVILGAQEILDDVAAEFDLSEPIPIIIKETSSASNVPDGPPAITAANMKRTIAFLHELGHVSNNSPANLLASGSAPSGTPTSAPMRLTNDPQTSRLEAVLWFHYHLAASNRSNLIDRNTFPVPTPVAQNWHRFQEINSQVCDPLPTADAGPDAFIFCGDSTQLHASCANSVLWSPGDSLDDPTSATPTASPQVTTEYTLTATDTCGNTATDTVTVHVTPRVQNLRVQETEIYAGQRAHIQFEGTCGQIDLWLRWLDGSDLLLVDDHVIVPNTNTIEICLDADLQEQAYTIRATLSDDQNQQIADSSLFFVDHPETSVEALAAGPLQPSGSVPIRWTWTGEPGEARVDLYRDGVFDQTLADPVSNDKGSTNEFVWSYSGLEPGPIYRIRVTPINRCGPADLFFGEREFTVASPAVGVFRPSTNRFFLDVDKNGAIQLPGVDRLLTMGASGDVPLTGDWTGVGLRATGLFRPSTNQFFLDLDADGSIDLGNGDVMFFMGASGDLPLVGDWNGSGAERVGLFRPSTNTFYLDVDGDQAIDTAQGDLTAVMGGPNDLPLVGDWNGDGQDELGLFRTTTNQFFLDVDGNGSIALAAGDTVHVMGGAGDLPLVGDWDDDGTDEIGLFRPSTNQFFFDIDGNGQIDVAQGDRVLVMGGSGDRPLVGPFRPTPFGGS